MRPGSLAARLVLVGVTALFARPALAVDPDFRVHAESFPITPLTRLVLGIDSGPVPLSMLTREGHANGLALVTADTWDFSGLRGQPRVLQEAPVAPGWSCYVPEPAGLPDPPCGFDLPGNDLLLVQDALDTGGRDVLALDWDGAGTWFLRAWAIDEGNTPATSDVELRLCFTENDNRHEVPFLRFQNQEPDGRYYLTAGDPRWESDLFDCDTFGSNVVVATQGAPCGSAGGQQAALTDGAGTLGRFTGEVRGIGTLTLPSGHVLDAALVQIFASFEGVLTTLCLGADEVTEQHQLVWLVPEYGPIAQVRSPSDQGPDLASWTNVSSTVIGHGLLPPVSATVEGVTDTTLTVSWDPGAFPGDHEGYEVHWDVTSGHDAPPAFSSGFLPAADGTSYTIEGLAPETTWFVSVTSAASYTDPVSGVTTDYRSIALPVSIGADVDGDGTRDTSYPPETTATTLAAGAGSLARGPVVTLAGDGPVPPVASVFDPACVSAAHGLCPESFVPGELPLTVPDEALPSGVPSLTIYGHSSPVETVRVRREGAALVFDPS